MQSELKIEAFSTYSSIFERSSSSFSRNFGH